MFGRNNTPAFLLALALVASVNAQFGNMFEQFMGGQQRQQQQTRQNVASDSSWYQQTYNNGNSLPWALCESFKADIPWPTVQIISVQGL